LREERTAVAEAVIKAGGRELIPAFSLSLSLSLSLSPSFSLALCGSDRRGGV
jgi:hypothetical protein